MKQYISEARAIYEDNHHGLFSKRLAEWAINKMEVKDPTTGRMRKLNHKILEEVLSILKNYGKDIQDKYAYTAWYLFNMAMADYPKTLKNDEQRACFVEETLFDPDGTPYNVLDCFVAKMCNAKEPIHWEDMV
ncbi:MAG: hypothetical protein K6D91_05950 [Prevotella sp.]|nr:hypothetical protein [Prevotella sp.]